MADFSQLKADFNEGGAHEIYTNGSQAISGARLNYVLNNIVDTIDSEKSDPVTISQNTQTGAVTLQVGSQTPVVIEKNVIEGDVTNNPDEVDITATDDNKLQFKDRPNTNGMGYKILRAEKTFAEQVTDEDTIYEIRYEFDLDGEEVEIPANCVLKFNGGKTSNGTLVGDNTNIIAEVVSIFSEIVISGTWVVPSIHGKWFEDVHSDNVLKQVFNLTNENVLNNIFIGEGVHYVSATQNEDILVVSSNTHVFLTGTIQLIANNLTRVRVFGTKKNSRNVHFGGAGTIIGDKMTTTLTTGESKHGIMLNDSTDVVIEGLHIKDCFGDGICIGGSADGTDHVNTNVTIENVTIDNCRRQGISVIYADNVTINNCVITNISGTAPQSGIDVEPNSNGYCKNIIISNCIFNGNAGADIYVTSPDSAGVYERAKNIEIKNCIGNKGLDISRCTNISISNVIGFSYFVNLNTGNVSVSDSVFSSIGGSPTYNENQVLKNCVVHAKENFNLRCVLIGCTFIGSSETLYYANLVNVKGCKFHNILCNLREDALVFDENSIEFDGITSTYAIRFYKSMDVGKIRFSVNNANSPYCLFTYQVTNLVVRCNDVVVDGNTPPTYLAYISSGSRLIIDQIVSSKQNKDGGGMLFINRSTMKNGADIYEYDHAKLGVNRGGTFAGKPSSDDIYIGFHYFCTDKQTSEGATNGIDIIHKGNNVWVDALGRTIS